jgi:hypothetical protein
VGWPIDPERRCADAFVVTNSDSFRSSFRSRRCDDMRFSIALLADEADARQSSMMHLQPPISNRCAELAFGAFDLRPSLRNIVGRLKHTQNQGRSWTNRVRIK